MGIAGKHVDCFDLIPGYFEFQDLLCSDLPLLDQAMAGDYDEKLPFAVVPVLAFGDAGFGNVHADLTAFFGLQKFCETASGIPFRLLHCHFLSYIDKKSGILSIHSLFQHFI